MPNSKQTHIFATRSDLVPGLSKIEADLGIRYARCGQYAGMIFEQYLSLLEWDGLGKNTTGDHVSGPTFLVVLRSHKINLEPISDVRNSSDTCSPKAQRVFSIDKVGELSGSASSIEEALGALEGTTGSDNNSEACGKASHALSQKLNPDSIVFSPGGIYSGQKILIAGHIGTISRTTASLDLYKRFAKAAIRNFEKIGSYYVGPEAVRLMQQGYRMVTIGISSPAIYDLRRK